METPFGWHVIEARPFDEIADSLTPLYDEQAGELLFAGFLATADIHVDPRYGRWDARRATVVAARERSRDTSRSSGSGLAVTST